MTAPDDTDAVSAEDLTSLVYAVGGVAEIFSPSPLVARIPTVVSALIAGGGAERLVRVEATDEGGRRTVRARIGTDRGASTPDTARHVADVMLERLTGDGIVHLQVARIS